MRCKSLSLSEQKQTGRGYTCVGQCPDGFTRDEYQACIDINECENPSACPSGASCINQIGGYKCVFPENCTDWQGLFRCKCDAGSFYNISTNTCQGSIFKYLRLILF